MRAYFITYSVYRMHEKNIIILNFFSITLIKLPIANNTLIQVWIKSIKVDGRWQFHVDSPIPNICDINMGGGSEEVHVRARVHGSTDLYYQNGVNADFFYYSCEYCRESLIYSNHKNEILRFGCSRSPNATAGILFVFLSLRLNIYLCKHVPYQNQKNSKTVQFCMNFFVTPIDSNFCDTIFLEKKVVKSWYNQ